MPAFLFLFAALAVMAFTPIYGAAEALVKAQRHIPRFRIVSEGIYAGGNPTSRAQGLAGLEALLELRIYTHINLQGGDIDNTIAGRVSYYRQKGEHAHVIAHEREFFESRGLQFYNFPLKSHGPKTDLEDRDIRQALRMMAEASPLFPLFIHCEHGADRTGLLIALFRVVHQGWSAQEAYREWVANGHGRVAKFFTGHLDHYFYRFIAEQTPGREDPVQMAANLDCQQNLVLD